MRGRHADVYEGDIRPQVADAGKQAVGVAHLGDDVDLVLDEQTSYPLANKGCVVGDYDGTALGRKLSPSLF